MLQQEYGSVLFFEAPRVPQHYALIKLVAKPEIVLEQEELLGENAIRVP